MSSVKKYKSSGKRTARAINVTRRTAVEHREWPAPSIRVPEIQAFDLSQNLSVTISGQILGGWMAVPSAAGAPDRQGLRISPVCFHAKVYAYCTTSSVATGTNPDNMMRLIWFQSRLPAPTPGTVLAFPNQFMSHYNLSNLGQGEEDASIKILSDRVVHFKPQISTGSYCEDQFTKKDLLVDVLRYTNYAAADPINGSIWLYAVSNASVSPPTLAAQCRLYYTDV